MNFLISFLFPMPLVRALPYRAHTALPYRAHTGKGIGHTHTSTVFLTFKIRDLINRLLKFEFQLNIFYGKFHCFLEGF